MSRFPASLLRLLGPSRDDAASPEPVPASPRDETPFRRLVDEFPEAILVLDAGRPFYVNRALLRVLEMEPAEVGEENYAFARLADYARRAGERAGADGAPGNFRTVTARGRERVLEASVFPLGEGSPLVVATFRDATARDARDAQAREMEAEVLRHARLGAMGRVALGISHGIVDSLTAVLGTAEIGKLRHPEVSEFDDIVESARQMVRVIEDLSDKGRHDFHTGRAIIDLNGLVRAEVDLLTAYLPSATLAEIEMDLDEGVPAFDGVYSDFSLSVGSLLANAVDAMERTERRFLRVSTRAAGDAVTLEISHTGRGMERRELAGALRAASAMERLDEETDGPVMGLPTCRRLLSRYGATMEIASNRDDGTTYRIAIPLARAHRPAPSPDPLAAQDDPAGVYVY